MSYQAKLLIERLQNEALCNWNNDWKLISFFVGISELSIFLVHWQHKNNHFRMMTHATFAKIQISLNVH